MVKIYCFWLIIFVKLLLCSRISEAAVCQLNSSHPYKVSYSIKVDQAGRGQFTTVQSAIDSISDDNNQWIKIAISPGIYNEKVTIPEKKSCIFLEGAGRNLTRIELDDHGDDPTSAIFMSFADNIVAKGISFTNTYALRPQPESFEWRRATAARISGSKSAFYDCAFVGIQDTLLDQKGSHYFHGCYIEGALDFIYGSGQSIYEKCEIFMNIRRYDKGGLNGVITAQKKVSPEQPSGFVFKSCNFNGDGKAKLGRAWGPYSTVIIHGSYLSDFVLPGGWDAWKFTNHEANFTYVEANNKGPGSDTSNRVPWLKKLDDKALNKFVNKQYINEGGWLEQLPNVA